MTDDEQLLEEYTKEIHGKYYNSAENMTVARLIESHRHLRQLNREWNGAFDEARVKGYNAGYKWGVENVEANTIQYQDLRKMTIQDLANLIGEEE
jgi:hypothetical protein